MWWLGGIIRDVYLLTRYDSRIDDVILDTDYDAETRTGSLRIRTRLQGKGPWPRVCSRTTAG